MNKLHLQSPHKFSQKDFHSACCNAELEILRGKDDLIIICRKCGTKLKPTDILVDANATYKGPDVKELKKESKLHAYLCLFWFVLWSGCIVLLLGIFTSKAEAQYLNPFGNGRHVAQFQEGFEDECILHWHEDLDILREWQMEGAYWLAHYNECVEDARVLWFPIIGRIVDFIFPFWPENPTLRSYQVSRNVIVEEFNDPTRYYSRLIDACNSHVLSGHQTEAQFAQEVYNIHLNYCHCRQTIGRGVCNSEFIKSHPFRFVTYLQE